MYAVYVQIQIDPDNRAYQWFGPFSTEAERDAKVASLKSDGVEVISAANYVLQDVQL